MNKQEKKDFEDLREFTYSLRRHLCALSWRFDNPPMFNLGNSVTFTSKQPYFDSLTEGGVIIKREYYDYMYRLIGYWLYTIIMPSGATVQEIEKGLELKKEISK
jgi:hypothetical protein